MEFETFIENRRQAFRPIFDPPLTRVNTVPMELAGTGGEFEALDAVEMDARIQRRIESAGAIAGVGGYLENRSIYRDTELFQGDSERSIHIGVDVFMPAGTALFAPLDGTVHSFANRQVEGDYGPVIILRHFLDDYAFHSLYGHLTESSLAGLREGMPISAGDRFAEIGPRSRNGNWTPHLHFQLVRDMGGFRGDYPGVVRPSEVGYYRANCPDPMAILLT